MIERTGKRGFASHPGDAESWVRTAELQPDGKSAGNAFTARLTIDITPELLAREFPLDDGDQP